MVCGFSHRDDVTPERAVLMKNGDQRQMAVRTFRCERGGMATIFKDV